VKEYCCFLTPTRATFPGDAAESELALVAAHVEHLDRLVGEGLLVMAGRTQEDADPVGLVVFRARSDDEAERLMEEDPAVKGGVFRARVRRYAVAMMEGRG